MNSASRLVADAGERLAAYTERAASYDRDTAAFEGFRRVAVEALPVRPGETALCAKLRRLQPAMGTPGTPHRKPAGPRAGVRRRVPADRLHTSRVFPLASPSCSRRGGNRRRQPAATPARAAMRTFRLTRR